MTDKVRYYKNRYVISFYEKDDDTLYKMFNNADEIINELGRVKTDQLRRQINVELYRALKHRNNRTTMLGRTMFVHIIDISEDDVDNIEENKEEL